MVRGPWQETRRKGQRDQRLRGKRCEGKKTLRLQPQPLCHRVPLNRLCPGLGDGEDKQRLRRLTKAPEGHVEGRHKHPQPGLPEVRRKEGACETTSCGQRARDAGWGGQPLGRGGGERSCLRCLSPIDREASVPDRPPRSLAFQNESMASSISAVSSQGQRGGGSGLDVEGPSKQESGPKCSVLCSCPRSQDPIS